MHKADILCNQWGGQEKLHSGHGGSGGSAQETGGHAFECSAMSWCCVLYPSCSAEKVWWRKLQTLSHVLFQHTSVNSMPVGLGKQN